MLGDLPQEILLNMGSYLSPHKQAQLTRVSQSFYRLFNDDHLWAANIRRDFGREFNAVSGLSARRVYEDYRERITIFVQLLHKSPSQFDDAEELEKLVLFYKELAERINDIISANPRPLSLLSICRFLTQQGYDVNTQHTFSITLLHVATLMRDSAAVEQLLAAKANPILYTDFLQSDAMNETALDLVLYHYSKDEVLAPSGQAIISSLVNAMPGSSINAIAGKAHDLGYTAFVSCLNRPYVPRQS